MATFEIQGADGKTYEVDAPDERTALGALGQAAPDASAQTRAQAGIALAQQMQTLSPVQKRAVAGIDQDTLQPARVPAFAPPGYNALIDRIEGDDALSKMRTTSGGILEGIPILGPMIRGGVDRAAAATIAGASDETYDQVLKRIQAGTVAEKSMNPNLDKASQVTGAVAGTIPAMAAAPGAFGIGVTSAPLRFGASALTGGLINGTDAAVRSGGDPTATGWGAGVGFSLGALAPAIGPLVGRGVKYVADGWNLGGAARELGIDKVAAAMLSRAAGRDTLDAGALGQMDKLGPGGMIMDLGENLRSQAAGLAALPGEGKTIVKGAVGAREADANWRIRSGLDETLGEAPTPSHLIDRANRNQQLLAPEYREALRDAGPVDTLPIARYLETEAQTLRGEPQRLIQRVRTMLDHQPTPADIARARALGQPAPGPSLVADAAELLNTRHAIDDLLETAQGTNARNALTTARQAVDDELRASVPGIKEVDAKYSELARQKEAVGRGQSVLAGGREAPRPNELADEVRQGALPQGLQIGPSAVPVRLRQGARAEIERLVGTTANDRVALQRAVGGEGDWNRARLSTLFGREPTGKVLDMLERERHFAETTDQVVRNSYTAARQASQQELTGSGAEAFGVPQAFMAGGVAGAARATAMKGVDAVVEALSGIKNEATRSAMAKILTSNDPEVLEALLRAGRGSRVNGSEIDKVARSLLLSQGHRSAIPQQ
ncbi:hypothetical protein NKJ16_08645 [Mesorhizobium sp. M0179]|uniref:hypothetical protein n=1 Tax=Mesorhizobium sp. M0179 TaxID=2956905 RepID=UPI00333C2C4C